MVMNEKSIFFSYERGRTTSFVVHKFEERVKADMYYRFGAKKTRVF